MASKFCSCQLCKCACKTNPGWMTPEEARLAIDAGLAKKLMRDWLEPCSQVGNEDRIYLLCPASEFCEGEDAPSYEPANIFDAFFGDWKKGRCVLLGADDCCSIHDSGFKPKQCRLTFCCDEVDYNHPSHEASNYQVAALWNTQEGRDTLTAWFQAIEGLIP